MSIKTVFVKSSLCVLVALLGCALPSCQRCATPRHDKNYHLLVAKLDSCRALLIENPSATLHFIDSIKPIVTKRNDDSLYLVFLRLEGEANYAESAVDKAFNYFRLALNMRFQDCEDIQSDIYTFIGDHYNYLGDSKKALQMADSAEMCLLQLPEQKRATLTQYKIALIRGLAHFTLHDYQTMQLHMDKALKLAIKQKNPQNELFAYSYLGYFYTEMNNGAQAYEYFCKALDLSEQAQNYDAIFCNEINLADNLQQRNIYGEATVHLKRATEIFEQKFSNDLIKSLWIKHINAKFLYSQEELREAATEAEEAYEIALSIGDDKLLQRLNLLLAKIKMKQGDNSQALSYANRVNKNVTNLIDLQDRLDEAKLWTELYISINQADSAKASLQSVISLQDSLADKQRMAIVNELQVKYETEKKTLQIENAQLSMDAQERTIKALIVISSLLLLLILTYIIYKRKKALLTMRIIRLNKDKDNLMGETMRLKVQGYPSQSDTLCSTTLSEQRNQPGNPELAIKLLNCMEKEHRYKDPTLSLDVLAEEFGVSRTLLSETVNNRIGKSFSDFVNHYRLIEAKRLLQETKDKMAEVSRASGFGSLQSFYAVFKSKEQITPTEYRKALNVSHP